MYESDHVSSIDQNWSSLGGKVGTVRFCPVCGGSHSRELYRHLTDNTFFSSSSLWALRQCLDCGSAYLSPRPTDETIHLAYRDYYTHDSPKASRHSSLRRRLVNGYKNWRWGNHFGPGSSLGVILIYLLPMFRSRIHRDMRHLPALPADGGRLLDVGFGDGTFLITARSMGWDVVGVDADPEVIKNARVLGLTAYQGGVEVLTGMDDSFDVITMSHVIEHLADPMAAIRRSYALLKSGGQIWLETPNIDSLGHLRFGRDWRGLEAPRHLVLFSSASLKRALLHAGFVRVKDVSQGKPFGFMYYQSDRIRRGLSPYGRSCKGIVNRLEIALANAFELLFCSRREFVSLKAFKE